MSQIQTWIAENGLEIGDRLPPERELATRLGVSRATVSQALVAMEVVGMVSVRHGDGVILVEPEGSTKVTRALRRHARQLPEIIEARDALETKLAALAAERRTEVDLTAIDEALAFMEREVADGGRGVEGDERFHAAVTAAGHSRLLAKLMAGFGHDGHYSVLVTLAGSRGGSPPRAASVRAWLAEARGEPGDCRWCSCRRRSPRPRWSRRSTPRSAWRW